MASLQSTLNFPERKRFSYRLSKKVEKENDHDSPRKGVRKDVKLKNDSPSKRPVMRDSVLFENGASPPKSRRNSESESSVPAKPRNISEICVVVPSNQEEVISAEEHRDGSEESKGLKTAMRVLHSSQPTKLYGREDKVDAISCVLVEALEKNESTTLYISGPPGTGKTASVNYILSQPQIKGAFKTVYVNCTGLKSAGAAFKRIAEGLGLKIESSEKKIQLSVEKYLKSSKKMIMLVLDEMDQLESKKQSLLYTIFEWPSLYKSTLVLLGIANALDLTDRVLPRLQAKLDVAPKLFHFPSYSREEIISILTSRLKEAGVDEVLNGGALQFIASKVSAVSGDIRKALDIGRRVIEITHGKSESEKKVALLDVMEVINNVYGTSVTLDNSEKGESFPLHQKIFICTMVLIKKNSKVKEMTIGRVHDIYKKVCTKRNLPSVDFSEFMSLTELIESRGAIRIIGKNRNRLSKVVLLWDETEITTALKDKQFIASILDDISCLK